MIVSTKKHKPNGKTITQQNFRNEVNINTIIARYKKGQMPTGNTKTPIYGDFTNELDYQQKHDKVIQANDQFMALPAKIRAEFNNNPRNLIAFLSDPKNTQKAIDLGVIPKPIETPKTPTPAPEAKKPEVLTPAA